MQRWSSAGVIKVQRPYLIAGRTNEAAFPNGGNGVISVSQLTKIYGLTTAVDNISFNVAAGEIIGFLGPNGAGKSTTLKMLTCYIPPTSGSATVAGFDIFHQSEQVRQNLGYLPENVPMYTEMRVSEYLDFRGRLRGMEREKRKQRMGYVMDRCWLNSVAKKTIGHLSKGFRQRVGLADALLHNPPVLILDEPTVGLDPTQIRESRKLIKDLAGEHTVMLSTHILPEVEAVCTRVIVIASGKIVAQGTPDELRNSRKTSARVLVECRAPAKELEAVLGRVSGVRDVEIRSNGAADGAYVIAALRPKEGYDVREEAARTVIQHGWPLREVRLEHATLEEFFVQVTANQAMGAAVGGAA
jgi:ABC-2 type transport system ATP-binding protein